MSHSHSSHRQQALHPALPVVETAGATPLDRDYLAAIVSGSRDAIVGKDLRGIVTSWNQGAEALFGYRAEEMLGQPIERLFPSERRHEEADILNRLRRGERMEILETQRLTRSGQLIDVSITISPIRDSSGRIVGASKIARDITALKQREREITRLSSLYNARNGISRAIVRTRDRDALFRCICSTLVEQGHFRMAWVGWHDPHRRRLEPVASAGDAQGYLDSIQVATDDSPQGRGPSGTAFRTGRPCTCNDLLADPIAAPWHEAMRRRGLRASVSLPIQLEGQTCAMLNVYSEHVGFFQAQEVALLEEAASDISFALGLFERERLREQAERTLRSEKQFSDTMLESMPGIIYFYDESGHFLRWNHNFETVSGYSPAEISRMSPLDFFAPEEQATLAARISSVFERGADSVEANFRTRDGKLLPYFFTGRKTLYEGRPCLVGMGIDVSESRRARLEQARRERAEAADQIKSAFLATMSHELRTPLNSIIGFTDIVLQGMAGPLNSEQTDQLEMVRRSARHLLALVNDVLDISKIEAGQLRMARVPFDPLASMRRVCDLVTPQAAAKGLRLQATLPVHAGTMIGDQRRFEQILLNLLANGIKFTERGSITLSAELSTTPAGAGSASGSWLHIVVADTGIGIRPEQFADLFQPFRQLETGLSRSHEGTGLGLAICHRLTMLMGGRIAVASEVGRGSSFSLSLPLEEPASP